MPRRDELVTKEVFLRAAEHIEQHKAVGTLQHIAELEPLLASAIQASAEQLAGRLILKGVDADAARHAVDVVVETSVLCVWAQREAHLDLWKSTELDPLLAALNMPRKAPADEAD